MPSEFTRRAITLSVTILALSAFAHADDSQTVRKAVERSTLNQVGTKPFHLKAVLAPTRGADNDSGRTGEVEIWWASPTQWKREVRSPEFHQIDVVNGAQEWQKNEGDYFPEWLREISVALIEPVPAASVDEVLQQVQNADVKRMFGSTYFSWAMMSTDGNVKKGMGASIAITDSTGLLFYGGELGWFAGFADYKSFHGRMVARTVTGGGDPEVTAKVTTLEDLRDIPPGLFDAPIGGGDSSPLRTIVLDEPELRKHLQSMPPVVWPAVKDGPLEGVLTTVVVVDRQGKVREEDAGFVISDNPGMNVTAAKAIEAMQFEPFLENGVAVQVVSRITMPFKTVRPAGVETFDSARAYFENGRHLSFPAAGQGAPYVLTATFVARVAAGTVENGQYVDTWNSDGQWRREATIGNSRYVRARNGGTRYELSEGADATLLQLVLRVMEPIPAVDTFVESDWRIKRTTVDGVNAIRVLAGYENPDGSLDPLQARAYWFDGSGKLVHTYFGGIDTTRSEFVDFRGTQIAHNIQVLHNGKLGMAIRVTDVSTRSSAPTDVFELPGHEYNRAFTDEVR
jgi:hypothetical protein